MWTAINTLREGGGEKRKTAKSKEEKRGHPAFGPSAQIACTFRLRNTKGTGRAGKKRREKRPEKKKVGEKVASDVAQTRFRRGYARGKERKIRLRKKKKGKKKDSRPTTPH